MQIILARQMMGLYLNRVMPTTKDIKVDSPFLLLTQTAKCTLNVERNSVADKLGL